jgi:hypothetical protein
LSEVIQRGQGVEDDFGEAAGRGAHLPEQASQGGRAVVEKYGRDYMADIGRKGSQAVIRKYGLRFYSEIAARNKGVKKRRQADDSPH